VDLVIYVVSLVGTLVVLCLLAARFGVDSRIDVIERDRRFHYSEGRDRTY
jgi:hypothetical protein